MGCSVRKERGRESSEYRKTSTHARSAPSASTTPLATYMPPPLATNTPPNTNTPTANTSATNVSRPKPVTNTWHKTSPPPPPVHHKTTPATNASCRRPTWLPHILSRVSTLVDKSLMHSRIARNQASFSTAVLAMTMKHFSSDTTSIPVSPAGSWSPERGHRDQQGESESEREIPRGDADAGATKHKKSQPTGRKKTKTKKMRKKKRIRSSAACPSDGNHCRFHWHNQMPISFWLTKSKTLKKSLLSMLTYHVPGTYRVN